MVSSELTLEESFYRSKIGVRPRPNIRWTRDKSTLVVSTVWGSKTVGDEVINQTVSLLDAGDSSDDTVVGQRAPHFHDEVARLTWLLTKANQKVVTAYNKDKFQVIIEMCLVSISPHLLTWIGVGQPSLFMARNHKVQLLKSALDWVNSPGHRTPLVYDGLGRLQNVLPAGGQIPLSGGESVFLLSRSEVPQGIWSLKDFQHSNVFQRVSEDPEDLPFWLGSIKS